MLAIYATIIARLVFWLNGKKIKRWEAILYSIFVIFAIIIEILSIFFTATTQSHMDIYHIISSIFSLMFLATLTIRMLMSIKTDQLKKEEIITYIALSGIMFLYYTYFLISNLIGKNPGNSEKNILAMENITKPTREDIDEYGKFNTNYVKKLFRGYSKGVKTLERNRKEIENALHEKNKLNLSDDSGRYLVLENNMRIYFEQNKQMISWMGEILSTLNKIIRDKTSDIPMINEKIEELLEYNNKSINKIINRIRVLSIIENETEEELKTHPDKDIEDKLTKTLSEVQSITKLMDEFQIEENEILKSLANSNITVKNI